MVIAADNSQKIYIYIYNERIHSNKSFSGPNFYYVRNCVKKRNKSEKKNKLWANDVNPGPFGASWSESKYIIPFYRIYNYTIHVI